jgi:SpoU rRNA Methylase family
MALYYSLVITNISKRNNVTKLIEAALAYGCRYVLVVGQTKNFVIHEDAERFLDVVSGGERGGPAAAGGDQDDDDEQHHPNTASTVLHRFEKWRQCQEFLDAQQMTLVGVEIHPEAVTVAEYLARIHHEPQQQQQPPEQPQQPQQLEQKPLQQPHGAGGGTGSTTLTTRSCPLSTTPPPLPPPLPLPPPHQHHIALVMGNEGTGLSDKLQVACHGAFLRIPQYGRGTASLNVYVAAAIVLSQFYYHTTINYDDHHYQETISKLSTRP